MRASVRLALLASLGPVALAAASTLASACGGNVIVDGAVSTGASGAGARSTGTAGGGTTTNTATAIQVPDGGSVQCSQEYFTLVSEVEATLGCTPSATTLMQCSGSALVHDPCGCLHVGNEAHQEAINIANDGWTACLADGCCGPQASIGCSACPPSPTSGFCDAMTSQCLPGP